MKQQGFTIIELVVTIIILGILAVVVAPKFSSTESYQEHGYRAQSIALLRAVQLRAMQQTESNCHVVEVQSKFLESDASCFKMAELKLIIPNEENVTFSLNGGSGAIGFTRLGIPLFDCAGGCNIEVIGSETLTIEINEQGYIHGI